ncbi:hypothetical protein TELCIR_08401 [Teladorsagia circumcincta]|uniref:Uncharacterized protein n=1 Tax=Teladorsagia circumcincta TaxID=45464 RepID=A0A2G9UHV7_TELCI|nr:hypothetical protein TELCIR_08401 [Teladorsagia circumcincta]
MLAENLKQHIITDEWELDAFTAPFADLFESHERNGDHIVALDCRGHAFDHIRNDTIRKRFGVAPIADKMGEARLRHTSGVNDMSRVDESAPKRSFTPKFPVTCLGWSQHMAAIVCDQLLRQRLLFFYQTASVTGASIARMMMLHVTTVEVPVFAAHSARGYGHIECSYTWATPPF